MLSDLPPFTGLSANPDARSVAGREDVRTRQRFTDPLALGLDDRIARELRAGWNRQPEIDRIAVVLSGKSQLQGHRTFSLGALNRLFALLHHARKGFRPSPECRMKAAFGRERLNDPALGDIGQQSQSAIEA